MNCQQRGPGAASASWPAALVATLLLTAACAQALERPNESARLSLDGARLPARFRRQTAASHKLSVNQLAALNGLAERTAAAEQALVEADEQTLKRQLPELIAQAHNDKSLERALLRLIISASLRNSNLMAAQQPGQQQQQREAPWLPDGLDGGVSNNLAAYNQANSGSVGEFAPTRLAAAAELASLEQQLAASELPAEFGTGALSSPMDKREYSKPCLFNAISCVRTPFRKITN